jgi:outer membrane protein OmpA-like peptidoglycan-associated protein
MRFRWVPVLLLVALAGCSWLKDNRTFSVYFEPYSAALDQQALETIHAAAVFAKNHPLQSVAVAGFSAPPDPKLDVGGLSEQRAEIVKQVMVDDGVGRSRITTVANGIVDPQALPSVAVRRVDISIGK